jgi:MFS family permease
MTLSGFLIGMGLALLGILAGLFVERHERGRVFGILGMTGALGAFIGGLTVGPAADRWGYPHMLTLLAFYYVLWPLLGSFLEDKRVVPAQMAHPLTTGRAPRLGGPFYLLLLAHVVITVSSFVSAMGKTLVMDSLGFASSSISITTAISGAVSVPFRYLAGYLSDRLGRKGLMAFCYLVGAGGLVALSRSTLLWHFAITAILQTIPDTSISLGSAMVTDLVPRKSLARGMSFFNATGWLAGMVGFAMTGQAIQLLGMTRSLIVTAALPLIAIALLAPIRQGVREEGT